MKKPKPWEPPTAAQVKEKWQRCIDDMLDLRRNYSVNREYFMGNQWIRWENRESTVSILEFDGTGDADSRMTVNKVKPRTLSLLARLTNTPLAFEPRPHGVDQEAQRRSNMERQILDVESHRSDWEQVRTDLILDCLLGAVAAVAVEPDWDYEAEAVTDIYTGAEIHVPTRPAVRLTSLSALEFGLEPGTRKQRDARYWIRSTTLTPEQAQERYDLDAPPSPDADAASSSVLHRSLTAERKGVGIRSAANACQVLVYYERPSSRGPGVVMHVIGDKVVQQSDWPFPFKDRLNLWAFTQTPVGSTWKGETIMNDARQLQRAYNKAFTSINRHIGKADNARMIMPIGAVIDEDTELTGEVGEIIRVDPTVGGAPSWMQAPQIPRWIREHLEKLEMEFDDLFSTHAVSRGQAPGDRNSGLALSILAEKDETPLGPMAKNQQRGWQAIAEMVLATMRHLMSGVDAKLTEAGLEPMRVTDVHMREDETAEEVSWTAADLPERPVVHVPLESVTPRSQAAVTDAMMKLAQAFPEMFQSMSPAQLAAVLRTPDQTAFATIKDPQLALATWENSRMGVGVGDEEVLVDSWHDHGVHIDKHNEFRASHAYRMAGPEVQDYVDAHIEAHKRLQQDMAMEAAMQQQQMAMPPMPGEMPSPQPQVAEEVPA